MLQEIYPGQFQPSVSHRFIQLLEQHGKLLRNFTQNIDTLEQVAGIEKVVQCHGECSCRWLASRRWCSVTVSAAAGGWHREGGAVSR